MAFVSSVGGLENNLSRFAPRGFIEDNPSGTLSKVKMMDMYSSVLSIAKATMFVDEIFEKFDKDKDGTICFKVCWWRRWHVVRSVWSGVHVGHQRVGVWWGSGRETSMGFQTLRQRWVRTDFEWLILISIRNLWCYIFDCENIYFRLVRWVNGIRPDSPTGNDWVSGLGEENLSYILRSEVMFIIRNYRM